MSLNMNQILKAIRLKKMTFKILRKIRNSNKKIKTAQNKKTIRTKTLSKRTKTNLTNKNLPIK